jgi:hypothetical protein
LKYIVLIANSKNITTIHINFDIQSDGLHFQGLIDTAYIYGVSEKTGDDMIVVTEGDYATYELSRGNIKTS